MCFAVISCLVGMCDGLTCAAVLCMICVVLLSTTWNYLYAHVMEQKRHENLAMKHLKGIYEKV